MKKRTLTIALAVATVLGTASISTGSAILAHLGVGNSAPAAAAAAKAELAQDGVSIPPDHAPVRRDRAIAAVSDPDMALTVARLQPDPPVANHRGAAGAVEVGPGAVRVAIAAGGATPSGGQGGSVPRALGRNTEGGATGGSAPGMSRPATATASSPAQAEQAGGKPNGSQESQSPAAVSPVAAASPGTGNGSSPTETGKATLPAPTEVANAALPDPVEVAASPEVKPGTVDPGNGSQGPSAILPADDWVVPAGPGNTGPAKLPTAAAAQAVPEPSTLALMGIAALGLAMRRRTKSRV
jgi:hypothetical protein